MADNLKNQLMHEAENVTPAFDESLHVKTMSRVTHARRTHLSASVPVHQPQTTRLLFVGKVIGGMTLLAIVAAYFVVPRLPGNAPLNTASAQTFNDAIASLRATGHPITQQLRSPIDHAERQIVLLENDAKAFGAFVVGRLNVLPSDDKSL